MTFTLVRFFRRLKTIEEQLWGDRAARWADGDGTGRRNRKRVTPTENAGPAAPPAG
jgi:hypothetical protein